MLRQYIVLATLLFQVVFASENKLLQSQPQILFEKENLLNAQEKREIILKFNTAVLYLEEEKYQQAIKLFKQTDKLLKIPSWLNIGIAYYKLNANKNAYLFLKKIYESKDLINNDRYSYLSSAFYLYKVTNNSDYLNEVVKQSAKSKRLAAHEMALVADTLILQKKYKYALDMLKKMEKPSTLKIALVYLKLNDYTQAKVYLDKAYEEYSGDDDKNDILWLTLFKALKANELVIINDTIIKIENRQRIFHSNNKLKLKLYFNKNRYSSKQYLERITKLTKDMKYDFVYYFAPYIFEDYDSMMLDEAKGFILKDKNGIEQLNMTIKYNRDFLKVIKLDPIYKVQVLQDMCDAKTDTHAYEYYNLALSYAHVYDYLNSYKYFTKAYNLEHGNKLYAVMRLLTAKKLELDIGKLEKEFLVKNIVSNTGSYRYLAKYLYKIFEDPSVKLDPLTLSEKQKKSIFFRSLYFLDNIDKNGIKLNEPLIVEYQKDPLVYMLSLVAREKGENDYQYISRIQDQIPLVFNNNFIKQSLLISDFYIESLKAFGLFYKADFNIENNFEPTYLRTRAIWELYNNNPKKSIELIEFIQKKYNLKSADLFYIQAAGYMEMGEDIFAHEVLGELQFIYNDKDAMFLNGIKLLQDMKLNTATQYYKYKLKGKFIDFKLEGIDKYLEGL